MPTLDFKKGMSVIGTYHAGKFKRADIIPSHSVYNDNLTQPQFKEWIGKTVGKEGEEAARHDKRALRDIDLLAPDKVVR